VSPQSSTGFEFRIRERRATARRRFSAWMSRALRVRAHFFVIESGVSCAGRRLAARQRLVSPNGSRTSNRPFPCFVDAMSFAPSAQRAAEKFYLKQGLVQAAARASSCQGQVQVNASCSPGPAGPARGHKLGFASATQDSSNSRRSPLFSDGLLDLGI
jgi:hypothetical protein